MQLDKWKSGGSRVAPTSAGSLVSNGALYHSGKDEATRGAGCRRLDNWKSGGSRSALTGRRCSGEAAFFQPHSQSDLRPEELATGVWTIGKAEAAESRS